MSTRLDAHVARLKGRGYDWPIPWLVVEKMARKEDCRLVAYLCIAGKPSIGWGETSGIALGMRWTEDQADARFYQQVCRYVRKVEQMLTEEANPNELGAMTMFAYNIGLGDPKDTKHKRGFWWSTVRRQHNAGNKLAAARAFDLQNKFRNPQTGQLEVSEGLTLRRKEEAAIYLTPVEGAPRAPTPQAVEPESSLTVSPIARGGAATVVVGAATAAKEATEHFDVATGGLGSIKALAGSVVDFIGLPPAVIVAAILIGVGWSIVHYRKRQRDEGWS